MFPAPVLQDQRNVAGGQGRERVEEHHLHVGLTRIHFSAKCTCYSLYRNVIHLCEIFSPDHDMDVQEMVQFQAAC